MQYKQSLSLGLIYSHSSIKCSLEHWSAVGKKKHIKLSHNMIAYRGSCLSVLLAYHQTEDILHCWWLNSCHCQFNLCPRQCVMQWLDQERAEVWHLLQKLGAINETGWLERVIYVSAACPLNVLCVQVHVDETGGRLWRRSSAQPWLLCTALNQSVD